MVITSADLSNLSLLEGIDHCTKHEGLSLSTVASRDSLFLRHEFRLTKTFKNLENVYCILDLTTALLGRLQALSDCHGLRSDGNNVLHADFKCEKFLANLKHLLRCLRQIALDAVTRHCLHLVEAHINHWHEHWQYQKHLDEGWFAEWPNGQRPLSTTWPWNVKPSLLVLWGVCWMFYAPNAPPTSNPQQTRNQFPAAQRSQQSQHSGDFRTRRLGGQTTSVPQAQPSSSTPITPPSGSHMGYFC